MNSELSVLKKIVENSQIEHVPKWYCHFDDDTFLNFEALQNRLSSYPEDYPIYVGKKSISKPVKITYKSINGKNIQSKPFNFATGGAGWCINRTMYQRLLNLLSNESEFTRVSRTTGLPDDMTIGFLIESELGEELKNDEKFHSHLEDLNQIKNPSDQVKKISKFFSKIGTCGMRNVNSISELHLHDLHIRISNSHISNLLPFQDFKKVYHGWSMPRTYGPSGIHGPPVFFSNFYWPVDFSFFCLVLFRDRPGMVRGSMRTDEKFKFKMTFV